MEPIGNGIPLKKPPSRDPDEAPQRGALPASALSVLVRRVSLNPPVGEYPCVVRQYSRVRLSCVDRRPAPPWRPPWPTVRHPAPGAVRLTAPRCERDQGWEKAMPRLRSTLPKPVERFAAPWGRCPWRARPARLPGLRQYGISPWRYGGCPLRNCQWRLGTGRKPAPIGLG